MKKTGFFKIHSKSNTKKTNEFFHRFVVVSFVFYMLSYTLSNKTVDCLVVNRV